jgi:hypothetical protein
MSLPLHRVSTLDGSIPEKKIGVTTGRLLKKSIFLKKICISFAEYKLSLTYIFGKNNI